MAMRIGVVVYRTGGRRFHTPVIAAAEGCEPAGIVAPAPATVAGAKPTCFFLERYLPAHAAEWSALVSAVMEGTALPVTLDDGVSARTMAEAATRSARSESPVRLDGTDA